MSTQTKFYTEGQYLENHPTWLAEDSCWKAKQVLNCLQKHALEFSSVCEVGCGAGEILRQLHENLPEHVSFTGYEISPQAYEFCVSKTQDRLEFLLADLLSDSDAFFDVALCLDVFEHIPDYFGFLRQLRSKADYKVFHIPLNLSVSTVLRGKILLKSWKNTGHIHFYTKDTALAALEDTGYKILDYTYTAYYNEQGSSLKSRLMSVPRTLLYQLDSDLAVRVLGGYSLLVLAQ